ncbi:MAG TPA: hypothetical protein PLA85_05915, partial [Micropepsaceae bacterium]|nr:hypothetical protein [Micropepsaceae bacterium]
MSRPVCFLLADKRSAALIPARRSHIHRLKMSGGQMHWASDVWAESAIARGRSSMLQFGVSNSLKRTAMAALLFS